MIDFAYQEGDSFLHRLDPAVKFIGLIMSSILILLTNGSAGLAVSILLLGTLITLSKIPLKSVLQPLKRLTWFLAAIFLLNALFYDSDECILRYGIICISKGGLLQGFNIIQHTVSVLILSTLYIRTTTSIGIMKGIGRCISPLRLFGVPTRDVSLVMSIALQFIPVFFSDIDRIRKAQTARGADFTGGSLRDKAEAAFAIVIPAFISAFRRADELSDAIEARGYRGEKG